MKKTTTANMNLPEYTDNIDIEKLNDNFKTLDSLIKINPVHQSKTVTDINVTVYPPYYSVTNSTDEDIEYTDYEFFEETFTIEAGKTDKVFITEATVIHRSSDTTLDYEYFIRAEDAEGGGSGTSDYAQLTNKPSIGGITLEGNKTATQLGLATESTVNAKIEKPSAGSIGQILKVKTVTEDGKPATFECADDSQGYIKPSGGIPKTDLAQAVQESLGKADTALQVETHTGDYSKPSGGIPASDMSQSVQTALGQAHSHSNKSVLDNLTQAVISNSHIHSNKTVLDDITSTVKQGYDSAVTNSHTHSNKTVLDGITAEKITQIETNKTNISKIVKTLRPDADMFVSDETAVSTKVVPQDVDKFAVVSAISGRTRKSKNLQPPLAESRETKTVTFTPQPDGTVIANGTATGGDASVYFSNIVLPNGTYIFSGCPTGGNTTDGYFMFMNSAGSAYDTGNGIQITSTGQTLQARIVIRQNCTVNNLVFKPMVRLATETDATYEPYGKLYSAPIESVVSESKNLLDWSKTVKGELAKGTVKDGVNIISDYIPVSDGISYTVSSDINMSNYEISWYTDGKTYIDRSYPSGTTFTATAPTNAAYARCEFASNTTWAKVEKGSTATTYSPYFKTTISVPNEARNCVGYGLGIGDICNEIDFENKVYTQNVAEVDLGDYTYNHDTAKKYFYFALSNAKKPANNDTVPNIICAKYNTVATNAIATAESTTNGITISASGNVIIKDLSNDDKTAAEFKEFVSGVKLVYELATPSTTNLSDIIPPIRVESGGTITLENAHNLDVANTIIYKKEVLA